MLTIYLHVETCHYTLRYSNYMYDLELSEFNMVSLIWRVKHEQFIFP